MTPATVPVVLDHVAAVFAAVDIGVSPALALVAIVAGGALVLLAGDDAAISDLTRQALGAVAGTLGALAAAHGLSALAGLALTGG